MQLLSSTLTSVPPSEVLLTDIPVSSDDWEQRCLQVHAIFQQDVVSSSQPPFPAPKRCRTDLSGSVSSRTYSPFLASPSTKQKPAIVSPLQVSTSHWQSSPPTSPSDTSGLREQSASLGSAWFLALPFGIYIKRRGSDMCISSHHQHQGPGNPARTQILRFVG